MPLFYFDYLCDDQVLTDDQGTEFANEQAARNAAVGALARWATDDLLGDGKARRFEIIVRRAEGGAMLTVALDYRDAPSTWSRSSPA